MDDDMIGLLTDRLRENATERARLVREATLVREAVTRLRTGETLGLVMARLRAAGIEPADWLATR